MSKLIIKNGTVVDPLSEIKEETKDILIEEGTIVEKFSDQSDVEEINASGKTVIPAALDIHTHVASQQMNWARLLGGKNSRFKQTWGDLSLSSIARDYITNGYTFIMESNVFPSLAKQTHINFRYLPVLDKAITLNVSNLWALESEFNRDKFEQAALFLGDLLNKSKSYGLSSFNPFEAEDWNLKNLREDITKEGRLYNFSGLEVYETLIKANEQLGLPNAMQAHVEGNETATAKSNLKILLDKIQTLEFESKVNTERDHIIQIVDAPSLNADGNNREFIKTINNSDRVNIDLSMIAFDEINPLITSDRRLYHKYKDTNKFIKTGVEMEGDLFVTLRNIDKKDALFSALWSNAIDLALHVKNKWKMQLSYSFPNYSRLANIPEIAVWLLSSDARKTFMEKLNIEDISGSIKSSNEQLSFKDYIILTRASPAKSIGLGNIKGTLGMGADGDVNILNVDVANIDLPSEYSQVKNALANIEYVIKNGEIIKKKENIDLTPRGKVFWSERSTDKARESTLNKKKEFYAKFGAQFYDQFTTKVPENILRKI
ncbi:MAG: amidohydrolase family protein [Promethearchaeia archaeon]